eukprot:5938876-Prymnesium_polylepis.2
MARHTDRFPIVGGAGAGSKNLSYCSVCRTFNRSPRHRPRSPRLSAVARRRRGRGGARRVGVYEPPSPDSKLDC